MSVPAPADIGALANRINFNTRDAHNKIDAFMSVRFAVASRHGKSYRQGILAFYYVFQAIEQEIDASLSIDTATGATGATDVSDQKSLASKIVKQFWMPEFRRTEQLYKDSSSLYSPEYPTSTELDAMLVDHQSPPQSQGFVDMVHATVRQNPVTVSAYCHVMYLALFAGGKVMRSTLYRNTGLFPKFEHLSSKELARKGTNFFTFSDAGVDVENQSKWQYKKNYESATREASAENDKLEIIDVAKRIFERNMDIIQEIGQSNKEALTNNKLDSSQYVFEELKFYNKDRSHQQLVYAVLVLLALLVLYRIVYR